MSYALCFIGYAANNVVADQSPGIRPSNNLFAGVIVSIMWPAAPDNNNLCFGVCKGCERKAITKTQPSINQTFSKIKYTLIPGNNASYGWSKVRGCMSKELLKTVSFEELLKHNALLNIKPAYCINTFETRASG
jgi:hypothetical protein